MPQLLLSTFFGLFLWTFGGLYSAAPKSDGVVIVEDHQQISSLKELTSRFKGKVLYIDIWASWCGPCRREMTYNAALHDFVAGKEIELIYISADDAADYAVWESFINKNDLRGQHLLAGEDLMNDLTDQFYYRIKNGRKVMSLPTYLIIGKNGKILQRDARRPSQGNALYRQLQKALKKK